MFSSSLEYEFDTNLINQVISFKWLVTNFYFFACRLANRTVVDNGVSLGGQPRGNNHGNISYRKFMVYVYR